jgi:hypothetical protein
MVGPRTSTVPSSQATVWLRLGGHTVAAYTIKPTLDRTLAPRPYLHPVRTLAGVTVTEAMPADHRWHLGASLAVQDVSGANLWGGRTYVRDAGYTWRDDHGRIEHVDFEERSDDRLVERLRWLDRGGAMLLAERRELAARPVPGRGDTWALAIGYTLTAPPDRPVTLGSPATNGRPGGAGYGGFFWRAGPGPEPPRVFTAGASGEEAVNGSTEPWVALVREAYSLVFTGLAAGDHWFVRASMYPGVCAAFAFERPRVIPAGGSYAGRHLVFVADGALSQAGAAALASEA